MKWTAAAFILCLALGCAEQPGPAGNADDTAQASTQPVNAYCPMMPKNPIDDETPMVEWQGKTVAFCCPGCDEEFKALPDEEKEKALAVVLEKSEPADPET